MGNKMCDFLVSQGPAQPIAHWKDFFYNQWPIACPNISCNLLTANCASPYPGSNIFIEGDNIQVRNFHNNWVEKVCLMCTNGVQKIYKANWKVS
jgi:hypothetical protein